MKGGHDLGGKQGFGPIDPEPETTEPCFHADWERQVFALTLASGMLGKWNLDESRHARERQRPQEYLRHSYYENWLVGVEKLLVEKGLLSQRELDSGSLDPDAEPIRELRIPTCRDARKILSTGGPTLLESTSKPRFNIGDKVRVRRSDGTGHTRAPAYAMDACGCIVEHHGTHIFPDRNAAGTRVGEHLYSVLFTGSELWQDTAENSEVAIDLWEPYLELESTADDE